ncbi:MAG: T9SS type A sorting domain-containing protein [Bacteroidota bacterium]|jgi:hypothetical protein
MKNQKQTRKIFFLSFSLLFSLLLNTTNLSAQTYCQDCDQPTITTHTIIEPIAELIIECPPEAPITDKTAIVGTVTYEKEVCGDRITYNILNYGLITSYFNWQNVQGCTARPNVLLAGIGMHPSTLPPPYPGSNQTDWDNWFMNMIIGLVPELANIQPGHIEKIRFKQGCQQLFQSSFPPVTLQLDFGPNEGGVQNVDFTDKIGIFPSPCGVFCCEAEINLLTNVITIQSISSSSCEPTSIPTPAPPVVRGKDPSSGELIELTGIITAIGPCVTKCSTREIPRAGILPLTGNSILNQSSSKKHLTISPNPTFDKLNIVTNQIIKLVTINNSLGVQCMALKGNNNIINVSHLPPGIYFINLELETGEIIRQRVIKQ